MPNILIIDDDLAICKAISDTVKQMGHDVNYALTLKYGLEEVFSRAYDLVFLDVCLPDGYGLDALQKIMEIPSSPEVIIITGDGDPDGAELSVKSGAWDYIEKPFSKESITLPLIRALQYRDEKKVKKPPIALKKEGIVGSSSRITRCLDQVAQAATSDASVLITGETGTGKELFASAIHRNSPRRNNSFVIVDCAVLPENLVESLLFGHKKGAFTGADKTREGLIKQADGGTLFLDEVGELPFSIQKAFLRVVQEHRFRPLGEEKEIKSDFRLIAATNRNLDQMVAEGKFRQDLLFRIRSVIIGLPPLRERTEDIRELATHYMTKLCDAHRRGTKGFSPEFIESLTAYGWPGNVRELINAMESILTTSGDEPILFPKHLPTHIRIKLVRAIVNHRNNGKVKPNGILGESQIICNFRKFRERAVSEAEKKYLGNLMSQAKWNIKETCRISGLSRPRLYALLKKHDISRSSRPEVSFIY